MKDFKTQILELLESKGNLEDIDEFLIDNLIDNIRLYTEAKELLEVEGLIIDTSWGRKISVAFELKQRLEKEIKSDFIALGISPRERAKLKLDKINEKDDDFGKHFD